MYTQKLNGVLQQGSHAAITLTATGFAAFSHIFLSPIAINRIGIVISTATAIDTVSAVLQFVKRPTPGSAVGQSVLGSLSIGDGYLGGDVIFKDLATSPRPVMLPGQQLVCNVSVAGTDSGVAAGAGYALFEGEESPEDYRNLTNMTAQ